MALNRRSVRLIAITCQATAVLSSDLDQVVLWPIRHRRERRRPSSAQLLEDIDEDPKWKVLALAVEAAMRAYRCRVVRVCCTNG